MVRGEVGERCVGVDGDNRSRNRNSWICGVDRFKHGRGRGRDDRHVLPTNGSDSFVEGEHDIGREGDACRTICRSAGRKCWGERVGTNGEIEIGRGEKSGERVTRRIGESTRLDDHVVPGGVRQGASWIDGDRCTRDCDLRIGRVDGFERRVVGNLLDHHVLAGSGNDVFIERERDVCRFCEAHTSVDRTGRRQSWGHHVGCGETKSRGAGDTAVQVVDVVFERPGIDEHVVTRCAGEGSRGIDRDNFVGHDHARIGGRERFENRVVGGALDRDVLTGDGRDVFVEVQDYVRVHTHTRCTVGGSAG